VKRAITNPTAAWKLHVDEIIKDIPLDNLIKGKYNVDKVIDKFP